MPRYSTSKWPSPHISSLKGRDGKPLQKRDLDILPSLDEKDYYDIPSSDDSDSGIDAEQSATYNMHSNSGRKLERGSRWARKGKLYAWGPNYEEVRTDALMRIRLKACMEQFLPLSAAEVGAKEDWTVSERRERTLKRKRKLAERNAYILPHLASPSPPRDSIDLAPLLAIPQTYTDVLLSASMRHSLGSDNVEQGLQRTATELLEGEKGLLQSLGRLREVLRVRERDVLEASPPRKVNGDLPSANGRVEMSSEVQTNGDKAEDDPNLIPLLPRVSDTDNLWRVTQELLQTQPPPTISFSVTEPGAGAESGDQPIPTPVQRLFTCPTGITINSVSHPQHPGLLKPSEHTGRPLKNKYNLDMNNQCRAVDDALERIAELLADCNEYKERLEEARDRVADVARAKKRVWRVVKERAMIEMDRDEK